MRTDQNLVSNSPSSAYPVGEMGGFDALFTNHLEPLWSSTTCQREHAFHRVDQIILFVRQLPVSHLDSSQPDPS